MHLPKNPIIQESKKIEKVLLRSPIYPPFHGAQTWLLIAHRAISDY